MYVFMYVTFVYVCRLTFQCVLFLCGGKDSTIFC